MVQGRHRRLEASLKADANHISMRPAIGVFLQA